MNDGTIHVDDSPLCDAPDERRRDAIGRAAIWRSPVALLPNDHTERRDGLARLLPPWLPLGSVGAALREHEIEGAP